MESDLDDLAGELLSLESRLREANEEFASDLTQPWMYIGRARRKVKKASSLTGTHRVKPLHEARECYNQAYDWLDQYGYEAIRFYTFTKPYRDAGEQPLGARLNKHILESEERNL